VSTHLITKLWPAAALLVAACSPTISPPPSPLPGEPTALPTTALASPVPAAGGCAGTQVYAGPGPDASLGLDQNPWAPAAPASSGIVAYFWHAPPGLMLANDPSGGSKVLWVDHEVPTSTLVIDAHPAAASTPSIHVTAPAAGSPAGNYPSSIDATVPGCWHFDLTLGDVHATLNIDVARAP